MFGQPKNYPALSTSTISVDFPACKELPSPGDCGVLGRRGDVGLRYHDVSILIPFRIRLRAIDVHFALLQLIHRAGVYQAQSQGIEGGNAVIVQL